MRVLICAGGTGGGAYPALAALQALKTRHANVETLWVGSVTGMEAELVKREGIRYATIPAAGLHGVGLRHLPGNLALMARGVGAARKHVRAFRPDVLMLTGGYLAGPMAIAARGVPTLLYVPDIEPGLALKFLAMFADRIAVTAPESQRYFSKRVVVTGYPVRAELTAVDAQARAGCAQAAIRHTGRAGGRWKQGRALDQSGTDNDPAGVVETGASSARDWPGRVGFGGGCKHDA